VVRSLGKVGSVSKAEGFDQTVRVPLNSVHGAAPTAGSRIVVFLAQDNNPVMGADSAPLAPGPVAP